MVELFDGDARERSALRALADDLDKVRNRGIDWVDKSTGGQVPLVIPTLDAEIEASQWSRDGRSWAIRELLRMAIMGISDTRVKGALATLYALDPAQVEPLTRTERRDAGLLRIDVAPNASREYKQDKIRELRLVLAREIGNVRRYGFKSPHPERRAEPEVSPLSDIAIALREELLRLCSGRGVSPRRVDTETEILRNLPGVTYEATRQSPSDTGSAALRFLQCVVRTPRMMKNNSGTLSIAALNLAQGGLSYEARIGQWRDEYEVHDDTEFEARQVWAFERLAAYIAVLYSSPCATKDSDAAAFAKAKAIYQMMAALVNAEDESVYAFLHALIDDEFPSLAAQIQAGERFGRADLTYVLFGLQEQFDFWVCDYVHRVEPGVLCMTPLHVFSWFKDIIDGRDPAEAFVAAADDYRESLSRSDRDQLDIVSRADRSARGGERAALHRSLGVLAQMLAFNEVADYWKIAGELRWVDRTYMLPFPLVPVSILLPARNRTFEA